MDTRVENKNGKFKMVTKKEQKMSLNKSYEKTLSLILKSSFLSVSLVGMLGVPILSHAQVGSLMTNQTSILAFSFNQTPSEPKISYINGTKKLIIDFENAGNFTEEPKVKDNPFIEAINIQRSGNKLRIAIDTKETVQYSIIKNGFNYYLKLKKSNSYQEDSVIAVPSKVFIESKPIITEPKPVIIEDVVKKEVVQTTITPITTITKTTTTIPVIMPISNVVATSTKIDPQILTQPSIVELEHLNIKAQGKVAKLTLDLSDRSAVPVITQTGNLLIVDLPGVKIPDEFQKNVSTANLGSVVQNMDVATQKGSGRIVLSQNENWEYSLYQMDKKVVIEVKPTNKEIDKPVYKGKPFTLDFQNMDVRSILHVIADFSGLNIIASDSVTGSMTLRLNNVPWDQVLDLILESKGLQKQKDGNVVWVATRQEIADKNKSQLELNNQAAELAPLKLEFFQLNHYKAKEMKEIIEGKTSSSNTNTSGDAGASKSNNSNFALLSKRGSVGLDVRNNTIFIQDTETKLEEVKKIIKRLDVASKQVLIEAKLVVVDDKFQKDIGAKFGFALGKQNNSTGIGISNNSTDATAVASRTSTTGSAFNLPVTGGGSIGFTILNAITGNMLNIELSALEQNNRGKVISNPRLLTADNKKAEIRQGTEIPYVTPGSNNSPATVSFKDAVLSLGVTPQVSPNGRVSMDLDISKDTVGQLVNVQGGGQVPSIDTRKITTQVTVNDGQTVVLGGIYEVTSRDDLSKIPLLGDIPWIGNLFKNTSRSNEKVELLIFITPHVIYDEDLDNINKNEQTTVNEMDFKKK